MKLVTLSKHTRPGRLGFPHAVQLRITWSDYRTDTDRLHQLCARIERQMGRPYQKTWTRPQLNRRWYIHGINQNQTVRLCFKNTGDQLLASMLYQ